MAEIERLYGNPAMFDARLSVGHHGEQPLIFMVFYFPTSGLIVYTNFPVEVDEQYLIPHHLSGYMFELVSPSETIEEMVSEFNPAWQATTSFAEDFNFQWYGLGSQLIVAENSNLLDPLINVP